MFLKALLRSFGIGDGRIPPNIALIPVCAGVFVAADDQTVIVTILPEVLLDLGVQLNELDSGAWTITAYLLGYVAAMPLMGRVSDVWGRKQMYIGAMILFILGSIGAALAGGLWWLVAARVAQAIGAGALVPVSIAIVGDLYSPGNRAVPLGMVGASAEAGGVVGPLWGGLIVKFLDWPWVFWVNIPLGLIIIFFVMTMLGRSRSQGGSIDVIGGILVAISLSAFTLGLDRIGEPDLLMVGYLAMSAATIGLFISRQISIPEPLLPLSMFRIRPFSAANITHLLIGAALIIGMVTVPLMANTVHEESALEGGLRLMRMTAAMAVGAVIGGYACRRLDYRLPSWIGLALAAIGYVMMSTWGLEVGQVAMTVPLVLGGIGFGLLIAPISLAAINSVTAEVRGVAAAMVTAMRLVGMTAGIAAIAAWGTGRFTDLTVGMSLPLPQSGDTPEESQARADLFTAELIDIGLSLFSNFFVFAAILCMVALVPAAFMAWNYVQTRESEAALQEQPAEFQ